MNSQNVLIIADKEDMEFLGSESRSNQWNLIWKVIDYSKLHKEVEKIRDLIAKHDVDFVLYSRNDQVAKKIRIGPVTKKLGIGYSSFSGIDDQYRKEQTITCFNDFLKTNVDFDLHIPEQERTIDFAVSEKGSAGFFSLVFDTEQLGGVRFGLPRILEILQKYNVKSTFFITNLMKKIYPNILEGVLSRGHEIGIHGLHHEYLMNSNMEEQRKSIEGMIADFGYPIIGANFIGRMNNETIPALIANKIGYFVHPFIHNYALFGFLKLPTSPYQFYNNGENIWMVPVSVETYGRPWLMIKPMLDSAISEASKAEFQHITILLHPFRDGNLRHIKVIERLITYLIRKHRLAPVRISDIIGRLTFHSARSAVLYSFERNLKEIAMYQKPRSIHQKLWASNPLYHKRISVLYNALSELGQKPVLSLQAVKQWNNFAISHFLHEDSTEVRLIYRRIDPLSLSNDKISFFYKNSDNPKGNIIMFIPPSFFTCIAHSFKFLMPKTVRDFLYMPVAYVSSLVFS